MSVSSTILAAMITPAMFYAGLVCAAIPILIHLLNRRRFRRVRWAATQFLIEASRQNRRRIRIEELILLALRCLAMLLIGMVLARIFVRPQTFAGLLGSRAGTEYVILLDDSFSTALADTGRGEDEQDTTVFDRGLTIVERLVGWLREESPGDALTIVAASKPDRPIVAETRLEQIDLAAEGSGSESPPTAFSQAWRNNRPSYGRADLRQAFAAVRQLLDSRRSAGAVIYLVSDFQRIDWLANGAAKPADETTGPLAPLAGWERAGRSLKVILVNIGSEATDNLAVTGIEARRAQAVAGISTRLITRVANFGDSESRPRAMQVFVGQAGQPTATVPAIPAGQSVEVPIEVMFTQPGPAPLTVELQADALPIDNSRYCVVPVAKALRILIVNGEPSTDLYEDEAFVLSVALRPQGPQFSGNEITIVDGNDLDQADLTSFHVVMLANVTRVSENAAPRIESYVAAGGGLAVFLGDQVDTEAYNRILFRDGAGWLPARLKEPAAAPNEIPGWRVVEMNTSHPALRSFAGLVPTALEGMLVWAHFPVAAEATTTSVPAATNPAQTATTLLRLDDPDKSPLVVQRDFQGGHVWMITTSADKEWNNLPDHPVFIVLMMEMTQYLARRPSQTAAQLVGRPLSMPLDPGRHQPTATVKTPAYPEEPAAVVHAERDQATGETLLRWSQTDRPGIYQIELTDQAGTHATEQAAVNVDSTESDLRRMRPDELRQVTAGWPVEYVKGEELSRTTTGGARKELWPMLLILLVTVLLAEQTLAWWFGANRQWSALLRSDRS